MIDFFYGKWQFMAFLFTFFIFISCEKEPVTIYLFSGKNLSEWDTYLGIPDSSQDVPQLTKNADGLYTESFGLNNDPMDVFSIVEEDNEYVIRIWGYIYGALITKDEFSNYHLHLEFKWGNDKLPPRENLPRNSGLCYHSEGPYGIFWTYWMRSFELEIIEGGVGDIVRVDNVFADIESRNDTSVSWPSFRYTPGGNEKTINSGLFMIRASKNYENPYGDWNSVDLYVYNDKAAHVINNKVSLVAINLRHVIEGEASFLTKGKIQLQSEGAEVFYRNIWLERISEFPF